MKGNIQLDRFLKKELRKFIKSSRFVWRVEEGELENHHHGTFTTSKYVSPITDIHYCTDRTGKVFDGDEGAYYVYLENGDGEYFSNLGDAQKKVCKNAWNKKSKKLTRNFSNRKGGK